jgi:hypothetical protein
MQVDPPRARPGDEADTESECSAVRRNGKSGTSKDAKVTLKSLPPAKKTPVEILDDEEEDEDDDDEDDDDEGDEETFAVEKILNHREKYKNVTLPCLLLHCVLIVCQGSKVHSVLH